MKNVLKLLVILALSTGCFAMGSETIEQIALCRTKDVTYLVTISKNEEAGRAIWLDNWNDLMSQENSYLVPIQNENSFKNIKDIKKWMNTMFKSTSCIKISKEDADIEYKRQSTINE
ncbi:MAG: hypothetical protein PHF21_02735 [Bacilli bacterium]|nr:hypothetical protein [Bacilli bacterium]